MLMPQGYVRTQATGQKLKSQKIFELADREEVSPAVIRWQAQNIGLQIA
jgi:hypothetical protein